jgi:hypothetical protein
MHKLGTGRRINPHAPDLGHHDFPDIEPASTSKLAGFAALHNRTLRQLVADGDWEDDMERELLVAGRPGVRAFERFKAGTRGTAIHGPGSTLGGGALGCRSFRASVVSVQREIEGQLSAQAEDGGGLRRGRGVRRWYAVGARGARVNRSQTIAPPLSVASITRSEQRVLQAHIPGRPRSTWTSIGAAESQGGMRRRQGRSTLIAVGLLV